MKDVTSFISGERDISVRKGGASQSSEVTDEEAAAMLRACLNLFARWNLSEVDAAVLLGTDTHTLDRWRSGDPASLRFAVGGLGCEKARLAHLIGIHICLRTLFLDRERAYSWVRQPNRAFPGNPPDCRERPALDVMLGGGITDILVVERYLAGQISDEDRTALL